MPAAGDFRHDPRHQPPKLPEIGPGLDGRLIHVECTVNLDLNDVLPARGAAIGLRDKGAGKGGVARNPKAGGAKGGLDLFNDLPAGRGAGAPRRASR